MKPDNVFLRKLHTNAVEKTAKYLTAEAELIEALDAVEKYKAFLRLGYGSLWTYCTEALNLSESVTACFIGVMRKSREVPELKEAIRAGEFSVAKARKIISVITPENKQTWLKLCKTLPCKKLEKEVVLVSPKEAVHEGARSEQESRIKLTIGVSEELYEKFQRAQDILCQRTQRPLNYEATLEQIVEFFVEKADPIRKAQRATEKRALVKTKRTSCDRGRARHIERATNVATVKSKGTTGNTGLKHKGEARNNSEDSSRRSNENAADLLFTRTTNLRLEERSLEREHQNLEKSHNRLNETAKSQLFTRTVKLRLKRRALNREKRSHRKSLPAEVRHTVILRDGNRCAHKNKRGFRCPEKKWLDFHHIVPVSQGGRDNPENVTILCKSHHLQHHAGERPFS